MVILKSYILPFLLGMILSLIVEPIIVQMNKIIKNKKKSTLLFLISVSLLILIPSSHILYSGISEIIIFLQQKQYNKYLEIINAFIVKYISSDISLDQLKSSLTGAGLKGANLLQNLIVELPNILIGLVITLISIYLSIINKRKISFLVKKYNFIQPEHHQIFIKTISDVTKSVMMASIVSGIGQAIVMGIASIWVSPENIILIAVFTFLLSFVPVIGTAPITGTLIIYHWMNHNSGLLLIMGISLLFLFLIDNILKPILIGNKTQIHPLIAFLSAIGGLSLFGFYGLFLGPITIGITLELIKKFPKN